MIRYGFDTQSLFKIAEKKTTIFSKCFTENSIRIGEPNDVSARLTFKMSAHKIFT